MGATPKYNIRYPELSDPADITQLARLATDTEAAIDAAAHPAVALHAKVTGDVVTVGIHQVTFDQVVSNVGGWTVDGAVFRAPIRGVYLVLAHMSYSDGDWTSVGVYQDDVSIAFGVVSLRQPTGFIGSGETVPIATLMNPGTSIGVKQNSPAYIRARGGACTLTATLVARF